MAARTAVVAGTATAVSGRVAQRQYDKQVTKQEADAYEQQAQQPPPQEYQQAPPPPPPPPAPAAAGAPDVVEQLKELASLRDSGVLTAEEFDAAKAKLLA